VIEVPAVVASKARAVGAEPWLRALPRLVRALEEEWSVTVGAPYPDATEAFVAPVTCRDGSPAVLKLLVPRAGVDRDHEVTVLRLAAGRGCVTLLRDDPDRGALLLERLGPSMFDLGVPFASRLPLLTDAAARVWRPAPDSGLPTGAAKGRWLATFVARLWEELDRPCSERVVAHARACAERRIAAHDDERAVLVHGDVHQWNALRAGSGWKLVDPDGLLAEPEYDLAILMREDPVELLADDPFARAAWLAARTGLDATAIWEWGVVERVSTGLLGTQIGMQPVARQMLAAAEAIAAAADPA
jgi:streptomycin 6-kinase